MINVFDIPYVSQKCLVALLKMWQSRDMTSSKCSHLEFAQKYSLPHKIITTGSKLKTNTSNCLE